MESDHLTRRVALLSFVDLNHCKQGDGISERMYIVQVTKSEDGWLNQWDGWLNQWDGWLSQRDGWLNHAQGLVPS
jgi:hypothetical protein